MNYEEALKQVEAGKAVFSKTYGGAIIPVPGIGVAFVPSAEAVATGHHQEKVGIFSPDQQAMEATDWELHELVKPAA